MKGRYILEDAENSYLRSHGQDLVQWYPWGDEARAVAREQNKPLFLHLGYSACHWCTVMTTQVFSDAEVAALLNDDFIPVLVDREEYPVLDAAAMDVAQVMNGSGGWPLNLFLTPELEPFFVASFMPLRGAPERPGMLDCLPRIKWLWQVENESLRRASGEILQSLCEGPRRGGGVPTDNTIREASLGLQAIFDARWGGFGEGPKFPTVQRLLFLSEIGRAIHCDRCNEICQATLDAMAMGAIRDHLGGGFHRYSVDRAWRHPHFEKMLSDQAMMAVAYAEGFDKYQKISYRRVVDEILAYVLLNLYSSEKGFFASHASVPDFYLWSAREIYDVLGTEAPLFCRCYGVTEAGNYVDEQGISSGTNALFLVDSLDVLAEKERFSSPENLEVLLNKSRQVLKSFRSDRTAPQRDEKVLTDWNGLMIAALARCGRLMNRPIYTDMAVRECHRFRDSELEHASGIPANLDDYANIIWGMLETSRSTGGQRWLTVAQEYLERCDALFDDGDGGYCLSQTDDEGLLFARSKAWDEDLLSGNSVMAGNLVTLWFMTDDRRYYKKARQIIERFSGAIAETPIGYPGLLLALLRTIA